MKKSDWVRTYLKEEIPKLEKIADSGVSGFSLSWEPFPGVKEPPQWQVVGLYTLNRMLSVLMPDFKHTMPEKSNHWVGTSTCTKTFPSEDSRKLLINESTSLLHDLYLENINLHLASEESPIQLSTKINKLKMGT